MHWFVRTGMLAAARRHKAYPVVGDAIAKFRRDLRAFQSFQIYSRLIGWDHKWGFLEHRFVRGGRVLKVVAIRGVFKGPDGPLDPGTLLEGLTHAAASVVAPHDQGRLGNRLPGIKPSAVQSSLAVTKRR
jgi:hypothetical protein